MTNKNSRPLCIVGLFFFIVFVLLIILELPFSIFKFIGFFPVIIIFILMISGASASSGKSKWCKPEQLKFDHYNQQQVLIGTPSVVIHSFTNDVPSILIENYKPKEPVKPKALLCQFCETRIDEDARFCHQCGSMLE